MADVGDVDLALDLIPGALQGAHEDVLEDVRAVVADVLEVVDGRAAGVEADLAGMKRLELLFAPRQGVEKLHGRSHGVILGNTRRRRCSESEKIAFNAGAPARRPPWPWRPFSVRARERARTSTYGRRASARPDCARPRG